MPWKHNACFCTINSKINGTHKSVYMPILKLHVRSITTVANLLAHNNITISYYM